MRLPPPEDRSRVQRLRIRNYYFIPDETEAFGVFGRQEVQEVSKVTPASGRARCNLCIPSGHSVFYAVRDCFL